MKYCGMDVHKESITGCIMDREGSVVRQYTFPYKRESIKAFLFGISNAELEIAIEVCGIWRGVIQSIERVRL